METLDKLSQSEFENILNNKLNGELFKTKYWLNYPRSIFYYKETDNDFRNEIGIYTGEHTYGIYIYLTQSNPNFKCFRKENCNV